MKNYLNITNVSFQSGPNNFGRDTFTILLFKFSSSFLICGSINVCHTGTTPASLIIFPLFVVHSFGTIITS